MWEGSATVKAMFDNWIEQNPNQNIYIAFTKDVSQSTEQGKVDIDPAYAAQVRYIDHNGLSLENTFIRALLHELVHALTPKIDNGIGSAKYDGADPTDYQGETVIEANEIYRELGLRDQNSYIGQDDKSPLIPGFTLIPGFEYTEGARIDRSVVISAAHNPVTKNETSDWDSSTAGNSNDLLIGNELGNRLSAGDGNDFLYGNVGNDILDGGEGDDYLEGGADNDQLTGGAGRDTLLGGTGNDKYIEGIDGAIDTIKDTDGQGSITFGGAALAGGTATYQTTQPASWYSANESGAEITYRCDGTTLFI